MGKKSDERGGRVSPGIAIALGIVAIVVPAATAVLRYFGVL